MNFVQAVRSKMSEIVQKLGKFGVVWNANGKFYIVNSIIAFTISLPLFFKALIAFVLVTPACCMTSSISFSSTPSVETSTFSSSSYFGLKLKNHINTL